MALRKPIVEDSFGFNRQTEGYSTSQPSASQRTGLSSLLYAPITSVQEQGAGADGFSPLVQVSV